MELPRQLPSLIFIKSSPPQLEQLEELEEEEKPKEELKEELEEKLKKKEEEEEKEEKEKPKEQLKKQPEEKPEEELEEELKELEEVPISFINWWKAVYKKKALPSTVFLKYNTTNLFYHLIEC